MIPLGENPPSRLPRRAIHEAEGPWWIAKVKPRQEKALAFDLGREGIEYYLPLYVRVTRRKDNNKPRKTMLVLFPGYISFAAPPGRERRVYATNRVVNLIEVRNQRRFADELEQVYHALDLDMPLGPAGDLRMLEQGHTVRVEAGPMRGIVGTIVRVGDGHRLVLSVEGLGVAALAIDAALVKPCP